MPASDPQPIDPRVVSVNADYYQQFDADCSLEVPAESYGGWKSATIDLPLAHTAVVVMHAWDSGTPEKYPGWYRAVEYHPRAAEIARNIFPPLLEAVRQADMTLFHVVGPGDYFQDLPGYRATQALAGEPPKQPAPIQRDPWTAKLQEFRQNHVAFGPHNQPDIEEGTRRLNFAEAAIPKEGEPIAQDSHQLLALCRHHHISHLIYAGFAINWCLLLSPGGMFDMRRHGVMCSAFRQAVTAVENKETARRQLNKEAALWRVSVGFGFVFNVDSFIAAIRRTS